MHAVHETSLPRVVRMAVADDSGRFRGSHDSGDANCKAEDGWDLYARDLSISGEQKEKKPLKNQQCFFVFFSITGF